MVTDYPVADALRVVALALGGGLVLLSLRFSVVYFIRWAKSLGDEVPDYLAWHVVLVSLSYAVMVASGMYENIVRIHEPATFRAFVNPLAFTLGAVSLLLLLKATRRR